MKLAATTYMASGATVTEKARKLKSWGYDGVSVFVEYADWCTELRDEVMNIEKSTGAHVCEFVFTDPAYGHLMDKEHPEIMARTRKMYTDAAQVCAELGGAITELEYSLGCMKELPLYEPYLKMPREEEEEFISVFAQIAAPLNGTDSYLLLEPINRYECPYLNSAQDCIDIIHKTKAKNIGLLPDTFHLSIEEKSVAAVILEAGKLIKHVHLGDNNRRLPGYGNLDWRAVFGALDSVGYERYCTLECAICGDAEIEMPKTAAFLRSFLGEKN